MTNREEVLIKKLDALRGEIRKGRRDIEISKSAITKMENELWCTSQELYLERAVRENRRNIKNAIISMDRMIVVS